MRGAGRSSSRSARAQGEPGDGPVRTVALVGGGHAHVQVLKRWAMAPPPGARLIVVLDRPVAVYSGMVPGFVAGDYALRELEIDVVPLARRAGASVILAAAIDVDPVRGELALAGRPPLRFDFASLDVGSTVRDLDLPGVAEYALATRPIGRFVAELDARIAGLAGPAPRVLVVGGGAAGCEVAFTVEARLRRTGRPARVGIATSEAVLLAAAPAASRRRIADEARARGIEIHASTRIARVEPDAAWTEAGERLAADLVIWATGAAPLAFPAGGGASALARDDGGYLAVRDTLQAVGFENVLAAGDCARTIEHRWVPRAGVYAVRQGPILDFNLRALLAGRALARYRPQRDFLSLLNLGDARALGAKWGFAMAGRPVFALKDRIDRGFMRRFQVLEDAAALAADFAAARDDGMACGGCAAKLSASPLEAALARLPSPPGDDSVVLGVADRDDVAATRAPGGALVLHNIDAITAFCDDAWLVARVAANNATSDLFAKGGRPRHAQALIGLPDPSARESEETLHQTLCGLRASLDALGVTLLGGHTMTSGELVVGLAVTGDGPDPAALLRQSGAQPGDELWLTKPLGTGVVLAADARGLARGEWVAAAQAAMLRSQAVAGRLAREAGVHAATDVTGFGLAGHLLNLVRPAGLVARIERESIPLLPGAGELFDRGLRSSAHPGLLAAFGADIHGARALDLAWLLDPQTAGGLLLALPPAAGPALARAFAAAGEPAISRIGSLAAGSAGAPSPTRSTADPDDFARTRAGTIVIVDRAGPNAERPPRT